MNTLVGAQVLLGLASGPPASYPLMTGELMSNKSKFLGTICVVIPNVIATGFGPYIGQRLVFVANWRWIVYIYLMMIGVVSPSFFYIYLYICRFRWSYAKHLTSSGNYRLLVLLLPPVVRSASWCEDEKERRGDEDRLHWHLPAGCWLGALFARSFLGWATVALVISKDPRPFDIRCCLLCLLRPL